jgi:hypothetical protein
MIAETRNELRTPIPSRRSRLRHAGFGAQLAKELTAADHDLEAITP